MNGNRLVFVKYPEGDVVEPIQKKKGQYFGRPVFDKGAIIILLVDFGENKIKVVSYYSETKEKDVMAIIDRSEITDCYNLLLRVSPLYLSRDGKVGYYEILWPDKSEFPIEENEAIFRREGNMLISSSWKETPEYHEDTIIRRYPTGEIINRFEGSFVEMPDGQKWILE